MSDDEESGKEEEREQNDREAIAREIFEGDDDDDEAGSRAGDEEISQLALSSRQQSQGEEFGDLSGSEEEGKYFITVKTTSMTQLRARIRANF